MFSDIMQSVFDGYSQKSLKKFIPTSTCQMYSDITNSSILVTDHCETFKYAVDHLLAGMEHSFVVSILDSISQDKTSFTMECLEKHDGVVNANVTLSSQKQVAVKMPHFSCNILLYNLTFVVKDGAPVLEQIVKQKLQTLTTLRDLFYKATINTNRLAEEINLIRLNLSLKISCKVFFPSHTFYSIVCQYVLLYVLCMFYVSCIPNYLF